MFACFVIISYFRYDKLIHGNLLLLLSLVARFSKWSILFCLLVKILNAEQFVWTVVLWSTTKGGDYIFNKLFH